MVHTFTGTNSYKLSSLLSEVVSSFTKTYGDLAIDRYDASEVDIDILLQAVQSIPFLSEKKLVIIKSITHNAQLVERLSELLERTAEGVELYLVDQRMDRRKTYYKLLQKETNLTVCSDLLPYDGSKWVLAQVKQQGGSIQSSDAQLLVDRVGGNQMRLSHEIDKLIHYDTHITSKAILLLTDETLQSTIFNLIDAAFKGDTRKASSLYKEQRLNNVEPHYVVAMLVWQLHALALAVYAEPQNQGRLVEVGLSPTTARKSLQLASVISKQKLQSLVTRLSELDAKSKSGVADIDAALELFFLEIAT